MTVKTEPKPKRAEFFYPRFRVELVDSTYSQIDEARDLACRLADSGFEAEIVRAATGDTVELHRPLPGSTAKDALDTSLARVQEQSKMAREHLSRAADIVRQIRESRGWVPPDA